MASGGPAPPPGHRQGQSPEVDRAAAIRAATTLEVGTLTILPALRAQPLSPADPSRAEWIDKVVPTVAHIDILAVPTDTCVLFPIQTPLGHWKVGFAHPRRGGHHNGAS